MSSLLSSLLSSLSSSFHPFDTFTFDGKTKTPYIQLKNNFQEQTTRDIYLDRPKLAHNIIKLYKEDIRLIDNKMQVIHPWTMSKSGFVVFLYHEVPECQDTKSIFTTIAILGDITPHLHKIQKYRSLIMEMDKFGNLK